MAPSRTVIEKLNNYSVQRIQDFTQILIDMKAKHQAPDYWKTDAGLQSRVSSLAQAATFRDYNVATRQTVGEVVSVLPAEVEYSFVWTTHPEESTKGPCEACMDMDSIEFTAEEAEGVDINEHPNCHCTWEIELE